MTTKVKKTVYVVAATLLGVFLSVLAHSLIESAYINSMMADGLVPENHDLFGGYCVLPVYLQVALLLGGLVLGYYLGQKWWRVVYVQKKYRHCHRPFCWLRHKKNKV